MSRFRFVNTTVSLMSDVFRLVFPNKIHFYLYVPYSWLNSFMRDVTVD